jgi:hypothetical protein
MLSALRRSMRFLIRFAKIALLSLALLLCAFAGFCAYVQTDAGRHFVKQRIEKVVTANIPGRLQIGHMEHVGWSRVIADDVRFFHDDGRCVLYVKHAEVVPDFVTALHGRLGFHSALADGGFLLLTVDPDGRASIEAALNKPLPPGEVDDDPYGGLHYTLRSMHMQHFRLIAKVPIAHIDYQVRDMTGFVGIRRIETPGVQVTLERITGDVSPDIAGAHIAFEQVDGFIHGKERLVAQLTAKLRVGSGTLATRFQYFDRNKEPVKIRIDRTHGVEAVAMSWLVRAIAGFTSAVSVEG